MNPTISKNIYIVVVTFVLGLPINSYAQELVVDLNEVKSLLDRWVEAQNAKNLAALKRMYSDEVIFYAETLPKVTCMEIKSRRLQSDKYFHLTVTNHPVVSIYSSETIKVMFLERVTSNRSTTDYDAYLLLKQIAGKFLIVGESDLITDSKAGYSPRLGTELKQARLSNKLPVPIQGGGKPDQSRNDKPPTRFIDEGWLVIIAVGGVLLIVFVYFWSEKLSRKRPPSAEKMGAGSRLSPLPEEVGYAFEKFVVNRFDSRYFKMIEWRSDKIVNGIYAESIKYPDLEIEFRFGGECRTFALECKYRRKVLNGEFKLDKKQYYNYSNFKKFRGIQVYVALGVGGRPEDPTDLFIIPLHAFDADGVIHYENILRFYNSPKFKFYYDLQRNEIRYYRKPPNHQ